MNGLADETQHTVTVSDFYMSLYEIRQSEYAAVMGSNPSNFSGDDLPVENVSWLDVIVFCNALSERVNLTHAYTIDGETVAWDRSANSYRLTPKRNGNTPAAPERRRPSTPKFP